MTAYHAKAIMLGLALVASALALAAATIAQEPPPVVYTSGAHVDTWDPIFPATAYSDWPTTVCIPTPAVGLGASWTNPHKATSFGFFAHPWQPGAGFSAEWINAWSSLGSQGPGGHSWTRYQTEVAGTGDFVLNLLADNCSWIYIDGVLVGFQDATLSPRTYPVSLSGTHTLEFIIFDGGGLAGGMFRLETNTGTVFPDSDTDGLTDPEENLVGTDPFNPDSDADGVLDGADQCHGADDTVDADADGIPDGCDDEVTPPPAGDKDRGHGNDEDRCDDDNPGKGGPPACADKYRGKGKA